MRKFYRVFGGLVENARPQGKVELVLVEGGGSGGDSGDGVVVVVIGGIGGIEVVGPSASTSLRTSTRVDGR